ncbi:MAG: type II toxin-antitoxin system RelE/ParE family toxin [Oligoflexia bacterium]|nr:type II toxin-antitoxin system RelE/ParE family toxin [Oligoflexia bacterium]
MQKYVVDESRVEKDLPKLAKPVRAAYSAWKSVISVDGFDGLRQVKGFRLEKLKGKRKGQYSCRLNRGYRVIFRMINKSIIIEVLEVNKHEY